MAKVNIISGFLGAGKTTFIKRLIADVFKGEKLVLIENEFGEIGVDGGFLQDAGIEITEMNSGCICCSLVGDFTKALEETVKKFEPDRIIIEPSGVGKLSDVIAAVNNTEDDGIKADTCITVADAGKCKLYSKNFGEFYKDQIQYSDCILLTRTDKVSEEKIHQATEIIREINKSANIITTHLDSLSREQILDAFKENTMEKELLEEALKHRHEHGEHCNCGCHDHDHEHHHDHEEHEHHHHHEEHEHHHEHGEDCKCGCHDHEHEHCHHDHEEHEHHHHHEEHEHHHHEHGEDCKCGCHDHEHEHCHHDHEEHEHHHHHDHDHEHHHEHGEHCNCGCHDHHHDHHHHHGHHADEAFTSWGFETAKKYSSDEIKEILTALDSGDYGVILRAKGMVDSADGWIYFDYVPEEHDIRNGSPCFTGKICVIGAELCEDKLAALFSKNV